MDEDLQPGLPPAADPQAQLRYHAVCALVDQAFAHGHAGRLEAKLQAYEEVVAGFGTDTLPATRTKVALALLRLGYGHGKAGRVEAEMEAYREALARFGQDPYPAIRGHCAHALYHLGAALDRTDCLEAAYQAYAEVVTRSSQDLEPGRPHGVRALVAMGGLDRRAERMEEALQHFQQALDLAGAATDPETRYYLAFALVSLGDIHRQALRVAEALQACREAVTRFGQDTYVETRYQVSLALLNPAKLLRHEGRLQEEQQACREALARFGDDADPRIRNQCANALIRIAFTVQGDEEKLRLYRETVDRYGGDDDPETRQAVARAIKNIGITHGNGGQAKPALEAYQDLLAGFGQDGLKDTRQELAHALAWSGIILASQRRCSASWMAFLLAGLRDPELTLAARKDLPTFIPNLGFMKRQALPGVVRDFGAQLLQALATPATPPAGFASWLPLPAGQDRLELAQALLHLWQIPKVAALGRITQAWSSATRVWQERVAAWREGRAPLESTLRKDLEQLGRRHGVAFPMSGPEVPGLSEACLQETGRALAALPRTRLFSLRYHRARHMVRLCLGEAEAVPRVEAAALGKLVAACTTPCAQEWLVRLDPDGHGTGRLLQHLLGQGLLPPEALAQEAPPPWGDHPEGLAQAIEKLPFSRAYDLSGVPPGLELQALRTQWEAARSALAAGQPKPMLTLLSVAWHEAHAGGRRLTALVEGLRQGLGSGELLRLLEADGREGPALEGCGAWLRGESLIRIREALDAGMLAELPPAKEGFQELPGALEALDQGFGWLLQRWPSLELEQTARRDLQLATLEALAVACGQLAQPQPDLQAQHLRLELWNALAMQWVALHGLRPPAGLRPPEVVLSDETFGNELLEGLLAAFQPAVPGAPGALFPPLRKWLERMRREGYLQRPLAPSDALARLNPGEAIWLPFFNPVAARYEAFFLWRSAQGEAHWELRRHQHLGASELADLTAELTEQLSGSAKAPARRACWERLGSGLAGTLAELKRWTAELGLDALIAVLPGELVAIPWESLLDQAGAEAAPLLWRAASLHSWRREAEGRGAGTVLRWDAQGYASGDRALALGPYEVAQAARFLGAELPSGGPVAGSQLLAELSTAARAHVVCHGYYSQLNPFHSGFSLGGSALGARRRQLPIWLLAGHPPLAGLRVGLSACEMALAGRCRNPEGGPQELVLGAVGVGPTLAVAGAAQVVGNLYRVNRSVAWLFFQHYYELEGQTPEPSAPEAAARLRACRARLNRRGLHAEAVAVLGAAAGQGHGERLQAALQALDEDLPSVNPHPLSAFAGFVLYEGTRPPV